MTSKALRDVTSAIPASCYENPAWRGLAYLARDVGLYAAGVALLLSTDRAGLLVVGWALTALATSALFVVGHDAAHGALFRSRRLCSVVARLAFLPSLHAVAAWQAGHNRVHHGHTGRRGIDFVWHPTTPAEWAAMPRRARIRHRIEWSVAGAGLYYLRAVWWARMMRFVPAARFRRTFRRDRALVVGVLAAASAALLATGFARTGTIAGGVWTWTKVFLVPWLAFNWIIGATVYVQHIHPAIAWHGGPRDSALREQLDGTATWRLPTWLNFFWHNVYVHAPHHLDPRIPFYHLPRAAVALESVVGTAVRPARLPLAGYVEVTRRCKLFDFDRGVWLGYADGGAIGVGPR